MAPPSINTPVVIDSDNKWLDVWDAVGGNQQVALAEQTYDDIPAVCAALQVLLQALGGTWAAATVSVVFDQAIPGKVRIHSNQAINACTLRWLNGPHGSGALDTHCGEKLGFDDAADDAGAFFYNSDYQHQHGWYATRAIRSYDPVCANHIGSEIRTTLSREYAKVLTIGFEYECEFALEAIPAWHMLPWEATGTDTNRAFMSGEVWGHMCEGYWFRFREDQEVAGTYVDYYLRSPRTLMGNLTRPYPDYEGYSLTFRGVLKE